MIEEHSYAVLLVDLPQYQLQAGDAGIVVHVYPGHVAYEVEFFTLDGNTLDVVTVQANQVRAAAREVLHARAIG